MTNNYDICHLILEECKSSEQATQKAEIQKNEGMPLPDAFIELLAAICRSFQPWARYGNSATRIARGFSRRLTDELEREPTETDLPLILFLKEFDDYFDSQSTYEHNVEHIVQVEANTPCYKVEIRNPLLTFSPRLVFHQLLLESAINRSMNDVFAIIDELRAKEDGLLEDIYVESTEASILHIATYLKQFFINCDGYQKWWKQLISDLQNPDFEPFDEQNVFYHLLAAQMCRFKLEFKRRMGYRMDELEVEVFRFYKTYLGILPDTGIIDILPAIKHDEATAECKKNTNTQKKSTATKKGKKKGSFIINENEEDRKDTISALSTKLCDTYHLIREEDKRTLECLLSGGSSTKTIQWPRKKKALLGLLFQNMRAITTDNRGKRERVQVGERGRIKEEQRLVTTTNGADPWTDVVYKWFVDEDGTPYEKLKDVQRANKWNDILDDLLSVFNIDERKPISKFR